MTTSSTNIDYSAPDGDPNWFQRAESWLDARGKGAWITAMVLGFVFIWPVGLALLGYMIWTRRIGHTAKGRHHTSLQMAMRPSGNAAFEAYKSDTLQRLEDEQHRFEAFLKRLRDAKDKALFDQFMDERRKRAPDAAGPS